MYIETEGQSTEALYKLLKSLVVPRPIAWVSTISKDGKANLAPFSFFCGVCVEPMTVMIGITKRQDGSEKSTLLNIKMTKQCVINMVPKKLTEHMIQSSKDIQGKGDKFSISGVSQEVSKRVIAPRILESPVNMECQVNNIIKIGQGIGSSTVVFAEVVGISIKDEYYQNGEVNISKLQPLSRLHSNYYAVIDEYFQL